MKNVLRFCLAQLGWIILAIGLTTAAKAQVSGQAFEGFRGNSKDPVQIEADQLEVLDAQAKAVHKIVVFGDKFTQFVLINS